MSLRFVKLSSRFKLSTIASILEVSRVNVYTLGSSKSYSLRHLQAALESVKYLNARTRGSVVFFSPLT